MVTSALIYHNSGAYVTLLLKTFNKNLKENLDMTSVYIYPTHDGEIYIFFILCVCYGCHVCLIYPLCRFSSIN